MNKKTILHAEDEISHAMLVKRYVKKFDQDIHYIHVSDGAEALDYLYHQNKYENVKENPRPDLVLLDIRMPKLSGFDVLKKIKTDETLRSIPVVMLSTSMSLSNINESYNHFANGYISKNIDLDQFYKILESLFNYWLYCNVTPNVQT